MKGGILIVDDDPITQRMLAANLERAGYRVRCVGDVEGAEAAVAGHLPDLALIDWMMPAATGITLVRRLRQDKRTQDIPVIILTSRTEEADKVTGLDSGADDYMTKPFSPRELLARVKALLRRRAPHATDNVVECAGLVIDPLLNRVTAGQRAIELGDIEFRMLHFFATHTDRVYSREQLLDTLWGDQVYVQDRTVDAHIRALRQALRPSGHDALVETVRGVGYCFRSELPVAETPVKAPSGGSAAAGLAPGPLAVPAHDANGHEEPREEQLDLPFPAKGAVPPAPTFGAAPRHEQQAAPAVAQ